MTGKREAIRRRSHKAGLPPGSFVHVGEQKVDKAEVTLFVYDEESVRERVSIEPEECRPEEIVGGAVKWVNVTGLHDVEVPKKLGDAYGLHPLTVEDILNTDQRPKLEVFDDYLFVVVKVLRAGRAGELIEGEQVSFVLGRDFLLSFQEGDEDVFGPVEQRIRQGKGRVRKQGADYLAYALIDSIVDHYFLLLEEMEDRIEQLESSLLQVSDSETLRDSQTIKKSLTFLRRSVWPLREVISGLQRDESDLVRSSTQVYLRDVHDHTIQVIDTIESFRELLAGILDLSLSALSNRMNNVMKVLTIIATIFIPLTFIAGVYGMNFKYMPELEWPWSYPAVMALMLVLGLIMVGYFKKKKWL